MKATFVTLALVLHLLLLHLANGDDRRTDGAYLAGFLGSNGVYAEYDVGRNAFVRDKRGLGRKIKKGLKKVGRGLKKSVEKAGNVLKKLPLNVEFGGMSGKNSG